MSVDLKTLFAELYLMKLDIPREPHEVNDAIHNLQKFLNRAVEIELEVLAEIATLTDRKEKEPLRQLLRAAETVQGNLRVIKQQIALIVNNAAVLEKQKPMRRQFDGSPELEDMSNIGLLDFNE